jgi:hypothetical protein
MARYILVLESTPDEAQPIHRLRALLKASLRVYGLRCVEAQEVDISGQKTPISREGGKEER